MHRKVFFSFLVYLFLISSAQSYDSLEISSGWITSDIRDNRDYQGVLFAAGFDYQAAPIIKKAGINVSPDFALVLEPFFSLITKPDRNLEIGSNFLLKYTFPLSDKVKPFVKAGAGFLYMSQHTSEQSTQFNFTPQIGAGVHFFLDQSSAFNFEYRFRHLSNCDIKYPNKGIDSDIYLTGFSFFF